MISRDEIGIPCWMIFRGTHLMDRSCILILLDGLGDRAYKRLGNKTPLQFADTPNLDRLASMGSNALFHATAPGICLPSENAHFALFGYRPEEFPGRGYLEAIGAGIPLDRDDVALLAHFVSLSEHDSLLMLDQHRPAATPEEMAVVADAVSIYQHDSIRICYHQTHGQDGIITMHGNVGSALTDSNPLQIGHPLLKVRPHEGAESPVLRQSAEALNAYLCWSHRKLATHSVNRNRLSESKASINGLVTQRAGMWKPCDPFHERWGLKGILIASGLIYWGLADFLGMDIEKVKDSDDPGLDLADRLQTAKKLSRHYSFIHVHSKAPDVAAHKKDPFKKVAAIELLDQGLGRVLDELLCEEITLIVTSDHSTPSSGPLVHSGEPVPFTVVGKGIREDRVRFFDEVHCAGGGLGFLHGKDVMPLTLNWLDKAKLQGLMDTPADRPYWPGKREFLTLDHSD